MTVCEKCKAKRPAEDCMRGICWYCWREFLGIDALLKILHPVIEKLPAVERILDQHDANKIVRADFVLKQPKKPKK